MLSSFDTIQERDGRIARVSIAALTRAKNPYESKSTAIECSVLSATRCQSRYFTCY